MKMATDDTIATLLELFQRCKKNGDHASLFMETMNGQDDKITFIINCPAGSSCPRRRWKTPSQLRRDKERKDKFLAKKFDNQTAVDENKEAAASVEKVLLVEPKDEIQLEEKKVCEKLLIIPEKVIDNHYIGIENDVTDFIFFYFYF